MDYQTQVNGRGVEAAGERRVAKNAAELWHHVLMLSELQLRLLVVELGHTARQARGAVFMIVIGCLFGVASVPVLLASLALVLVDAAAMTPAAAFGLVAGLAIVTTTILILAGCVRMRRQPLGAPRSRAEWNLNWRWLKETLQRERSAGIK